MSSSPKAYQDKAYQINQDPEKHGKRVLGEVDDRAIGLLWEDIESLENVVGVACGANKTKAILGALRTGLLDVLITDDRTAAAVLKAASK